MGDVKFIRVRGRIVPIRSKGSSSGDQKRKAVAAAAASPALAAGALGIGGSAKRGYEAKKAANKFSQAMSMAKSSGGYSLFRQNYRQNASAYGKAARGLGKSASKLGLLGLAGLALGSVGYLALSGKRKK